MKNKSFHAELKSLPDILNWIHSELEAIVLSKKEKMHLELALEEAIVNIIQHAKPLELQITIRHAPERKQIEIDLSDKGPPFNPLVALSTLSQQEDSSEKQLLEKQPLGGKGLILMRQCADALLYRREEEQNILTIIKKTPTPPH